MAKTPKVKKREVSLHSRAARRGQEPPSKDLSVRSSATTTTESDYKPWLHSVQNAGISKKKKSKTQTHAQKLRQQKALEKADQNADRLEKKVGDSKKRAKKVQARAVDWEELNGNVASVKEARKTKEQDKDGEKEEEGRVMEDVVLPDLEQPLTIQSMEASAAGYMSVKQQQVPGAFEPEEEDEVL